jgi:hypothetical protein
MMEIEVQRSTRHCAATGRRLDDGEEFFSALVHRGADLERLDYAVAAWEGPGEGTIAWWKSRVPTPETRRARWAPNEVLLDVFQELLAHADQQDKCYVMALLLVRRRILRLEDTEPAADGGMQLTLYCPREEQTYHVPVVTPDEARIVEIQKELELLLFAGGEPIAAPPQS